MTVHHSDPDTEFEAKHPRARGGRFAPGEHPEAAPFEAPVGASEPSDGDAVEPAQRSGWRARVSVPMALCGVSAGTATVLWDDASLLGTNGVEGVLLGAVVVAGGVAVGVASELVLKRFSRGRRGGVTGSDGSV